ncbi:MULTISPECIES: hypothetical protein [unclassified Breznakia]|uniref:hypothetical protein n=1 Tax=unclassified Breznakia TaxID=2623764 RepID=UPI0024753FFD|nr:MULTISPECIES: hypothetical protein [unclassified Breznakia]MDH6367393.1 hypothetical protein [Breznakia sp. PH1-1]MDH6403925.1 hypothetical protein [Breznakia sp. PF1-11]MDH6411634.1 hypothetical protein [Breznakia sp. PFB1-11]MDH6414560.1 hypothetical protein [Breznakia sp. PFB1-14]MDH6418666.1 hypothetical protein [Breznakia sp. PFB1-12]
MFDRYKVIIDSGKKRQKVFLIFDMKEAGLMFGVFGGIYLIFQGIIGQEVATLSGAIAAICIGAMFVPLANGLNIWGNIKLMINYFFKEPNAYYYFIKPFDVHAKKEVGKNEKRKKKQKSSKKQNEQKGFSY